MSQLTHDLRASIRSIRRRPLIPIVVVTILALGLAACAAIGRLSASQALPQPIISLPAVVVTFVAVLGVAVVAAALPARKVARIEISTALRAET